MDKADLNRLLRREEADGRAWLEGDTMVIDCGGCDYLPVPGSDECMSCMVSMMSGTGSASRIILRTGKDTEVSGNAGRAVREAASLRRWAVPPKPSKGRCARCGLDRETLLAEAWEGFPEPDFRSPLEKLNGFRDSPECRECVARTRRVLEQTEHRFDDLLERMGSL